MNTISYIICRQFDYYSIAQNFGRVKLGRIDHFRVLARKVLANDDHFAKFAEVIAAKVLCLWNICH